MLARLRNFLKKLKNNQLEDVENLNVLIQLLNKYPLKEFDYFTFEKENEDYEFYFSSKDDSISLHFTFDKQKEMKEFYFYHFANLYTFSENELEEKRDYFEELWSKFKTVLTKSRTIQFNMFKEGFLEHESDMDIDPKSDEFMMLQDIVHKMNINLFDYFTLDMKTPAT